MPKAPRKLTKKDKAETAQNVGFRLHPHHFEILEQRAQLAGLSIGDLARSMVIDALDQTSHLEAIRERMLAIEGAISETRKDISLATENLLIAANVPKDQAVKWVANNLKRS